MTYHQITLKERYRIMSWRADGQSAAKIARRLGRHRATIGRELRRNRSRGQERYWARAADWMARRRRLAARPATRFTRDEWDHVERHLREQWSPEQVAGYLRRTGALRISHETIYRHIWADKYSGGDLYRQLRGRQTPRRKRGGSHYPRGDRIHRRRIDRRPAVVAARRRIGDWEIDTILGSTGTPGCVVSLVERKTGFALLGQLPARTAKPLTARTIQLLRHQRHPVRTITADNGSELEGYRVVERALGTRFYFATPHHAWERGTNENTNGLVRQYLPKGQPLTGITQRDCTAIARQLNRRPRKRLGFFTPEECYAK